MSQTFKIPSPDLRLAWLFIGGVLVLAAVGMVMAARAQPMVAWIAVPTILLSLTLVAIGFHRRRVEVVGGKLRIIAGLNTANVALTDLDVAAARVVNLGEKPELRPLIKTFGTSFPGYQAGHFRLRDRSRAFALISNPARVLVVPQRDGRKLLISVEQPHALLKALGG